MFDRFITHSYSYQFIIVSHSYFNAVFGDQYLLLDPVECLI
jgi:hypothetical protein